MYIVFYNYSNAGPECQAIETQEMREYVTCRRDITELILKRCKTPGNQSIIFFSTIHCITGTFKLISAKPSSFISMGQGYRGQNNSYRTMSRDLVITVCVDVTSLFYYHRVKFIICNYCRFIGQ